MTELKTLKDFEIFTDEGKFILKKELKAEAVKLIKILERSASSSIYDREMWINFFNLTEEDLK